MHRGITKNPKLNSVMDIGMQELGQMIFSSPKGVEAGHQRILFFLRRGDDPHDKKNKQTFRYFPHAGTITRRGLTPASWGFRHHIDK